MSDEMWLIINDDGKAEIYDDTYDITIHCTSEEEKNEVIEHLNSMRWIPVTERLPEVKQKVLVQYADESMATKRCNDAGHLQWFYANAVAWIPAPEPYRQKGDAE